VWTVFETVGHANRANVIVVDYLEHPQPPEAPGSDYFSEASMTKRARDAVVALGDSPLAVVEAASARAIAYIATKEPDATVGSPFGTMPLSEYLPSRTAELTIHALDLVRALDLEMTAPSAALEASLAFVATIANTRKRQGEEVLFALTGRGQLPSGFSVY
jgi:hypothetical protein